MGPASAPAWSTRIHRDGYQGTRLKVHKIEIFLASILKFVIFLCYLCQNIKILQKLFFDWASIGGGTTFPRSLRTTRNGKKILSKVKYEPILVFPKFDPCINCARDGFMC